MINTATLLFVVLSSSITLRQVVSFECPSGKDIETGPACRLTQEQLDSFKTDKEFAQSYAMRLCEDMINFYVKGFTWEAAFGNIGESVYSETTIGQIDGKTVTEGYYHLKAQAMLSRNLAHTSGGDCKEGVSNGESLFLKSQIKLRQKAKIGLRGAPGTNMMWFKQYFFESDGTLRKVQYQSLSSGTQMRDFVTAATTAAKAAISSAEFIG
eukprot:509921_1